MTIKSLFSLRAALPAALALLLPAAHGGNPLRGQALYFSNHCFECHLADPSQKAGASAAQIANAIATEPSMQAISSIAALTPADIADLASYLDAPVSAPVPSVAPASLAFAATTVGTASAPLSIVLSNIGTARLNVAGVTLGGGNADDFSGLAGSCLGISGLEPRDSCGLQVQFQPLAGGTRNATLTISHRAVGQRLGPSSVIALSGIATGQTRASLTLSDSRVDFGPVLLNDASQVRSVSVSNRGQAPLQWQSITLAGPAARQFSLDGSCQVAQPLAAGAACTLQLHLAPAASGRQEAAVKLDSNAVQGSVTLPLSADVADTPRPALALDTAVLAFGRQRVGAPSATQTAYLRNTGNVALSLQRAQLQGGADFALAPDSSCGGPLAVGASCALSVIYTPRSAGPAQASIAVPFDGGTLSLSASGSGGMAAVGAGRLSVTQPLAFGAANVGQVGAALQLSLNNQGNAPLRLDQLTLGGPQRHDFALGGGGSCGVGAVLEQDSSCTVELLMKPSGSGLRLGRLVLALDTGAQLGIDLEGSGVAQTTPGTALTLQAQALEFGQLLLGQPPPSLSTTLVNTGTEPIALTQQSLSGSFVPLPQDGGCPPLPFTLQPGSACDLTLSYRPQAAGEDAGALVLAASGTPLHWTLDLHGRAAEPATLQNHGGGGCSVSVDGDDPMLALMVVLSLLVLLWRRRRAAA